MSAPEMNLKWVSALLVDPDYHSVKILSRMLEGFGLVNRRVVDSGEAAKTALEQEASDIIFCEAKLSDISSAEFIRSLRKAEKKEIRYIPVIVLTGYTQRSMVEASRDAGANIVLRKPISVSALYDRLAWVAKNTRQFVEMDAYIGPDRRFKNAGLPGGVGRRATDLNGEVGNQAEPNMSQDEIDSMIKPMKVDL
jgi:CheY-like chemotaxis protein